MRVIKMLGATLLGFVAFIGASANAQQVVPVSCTWSTVSSYGPPDNSWRDIVRACKESNGTLVANQSFRGYNGTGVMENCVITPATNISYTGTCASPSFSRAVPPLPPVCANAGKYLGNGCANGTANIPVATACGSNCSLRFETVGWTAACPHPGQSPAGSPEVKVFCQ